MNIQSLKQLDNGWLVNGHYSVPDAPSNRFYQSVQDAIARGVVVEPQYTQADLDAQAAGEAEQAVADATRADTTLKNFISAGPSGIDTYIENNVTDMASAKAVLKILAKIVWVVARNTFK